MFSEKLLLRLKHASAVTVLTGAGISAESGVPTFRGKGGLWEDHKVEELATVETLNRHPELFWKFYNWRRKLLKSVEPNLGHYALVDFERLFSEFNLITQNVDNLHKLAGNKNVIELHGNIMYNKCSGCEEITDTSTVEQNTAPVCSKCGARMRPNVVLFGENLNSKNIASAQEMSATCELFFSIGTSGVVEPAASLPFSAKGNGAFLVEINPEETPLTPYVNEYLKGDAGYILPQLVMVIEKIR